MEPATDKEGFLRDRADWNAEVATTLAGHEGIALNDSHWEVVHLIRRYYETYRLFPPNRVLVKQIGLELGAEKGNSIYLMTLFSGKPARVLARIAGLPKPPNCD